MRPPARLRRHDNRPSAMVAIPAQRYIGLMSGTSMDGVDAVLADITANGVTLRDTVSLPMEADLRRRLMALNMPAGVNELEEAALAANALATRYAQAVSALLSRHALSPTDIHAIGAHGQTVRHRPELGFTSTRSEVPCRRDCRPWQGWIRLRPPSPDRRGRKNRKGSCTRP